MKPSLIVRAQTDFKLFRPRADSQGCSGIARPWAYCCLVCNATSLDDMSGHVCPRDVLAYVRDHWTWRMHWALMAKLDRPPTTEEVAAIVDKPIARTEMARLLGPSWLPSGDAL